MTPPHDTPPLIPAPAELAFGAESEAFTLDAAVPVVFGLAAGAETLFAARQVQAAVHDATGLTLPVRKAARPEGGTPRRIALVVAGRDAAADRSAGETGLRMSESIVADRSGSDDTKRSDETRVADDRAVGDDTSTSRGTGVADELGLEGYSLRVTRRTG